MCNIIYKVNILNSNTRYTLGIAGVTGVKPAQIRVKQQNFCLFVCLFVFVST